MPKERTLSIPTPHLGLLTVRIRGTTGLIVHRFGDIPKNNIIKTQAKTAKTAKGAREPEAEFKDSLYPIDWKRLMFGFPAGGIKKALVSAGGRLADEQMTLLRAALVIPAELLLIEGAYPTMRTDAVRLMGPGRPASISYRPEFPVVWEIAVPVIHNKDIIGEDQVVNLFKLAGTGVGLGDWRNERSGTFGMFDVSSDKDAVSEGINLPNLSKFHHPKDLTIPDEIKAWTK